jgi:hypothetical protein
MTALMAAYFFDDANSNSPDGQLNEDYRPIHRAARWWRLEWTRIINPQLLNRGALRFLSEQQM